MQIPPNLNWSLTLQQAIAEQARLAEKVVRADDFGEIRYVAGVDVDLEDENSVARAAIVVLTFPALAPVEAEIARRGVTFPYVPGLLAYRELPAVLDAVEKLKTTPDLFIVDGQGYAHPRRFGIACHLGVLLETPSIGCAKSVLVGRAEMPENRVGAWEPVIHKSEIVGSALRSKLKTNPLIVSIGHRVSDESARELILRCCKGYRLPEPTRLAHQVAGGAALKMN